MRQAPILSFFCVLCAGLVGVTLACGDDADGSSSSSGGGASSNGGATSGGDGTPSSSGGTSGTSGNAVPEEEDDGLVPITSAWRATSEWYRPIDDAPVAEHSADMISGVVKFGNQDLFQVDFGFNVLDGQGAPETVHFDSTGEEGDVADVPIPARGYVEGDHDYGACPIEDDDCHMLIVDRSQGRLFEIYKARKESTGWVGSMTLWKLDKTYPRTARGQGCTSADAAGLAITPGLIGYKETKKGSIHHALRLILRNEYMRDGEDGAGNRLPNVAYPGTHGTTTASSPNGPPYGARLRLKKDFDASKVTSPGGKVVVAALKKYGMIVADGGNIPLVAESVKVHQDANPAETWEGLLGPHDLGAITPGDFEVIGIPKDRPGGATPGWYASKAEYEAQLQLPFGAPPGCEGSQQPEE